MEINRDLILKDIPLFTGLSLPERDIIAERCSFREYHKGQIVYHEGGPADAFYCVVSGRVIIHTQDKHAGQAVLEYLHRGKYFGIISLLTSEPHSVTAQAMNDCTLLVILKEDFDFILNKIPRLAIDLSMSLSRRLKSKDLHQKTIFESTIISVFSSYSQAGKTVYALNLALGMRKETNKSVLLLEVAPKDKIHSLAHKLGFKGEYLAIDLCLPLLDIPKAIDTAILKSEFGVNLICLHYSSEEKACLKRLLGVLSLLVNDYHYIVLDLPALMDQYVFEILNQSDSIHLLTSPESVDLKRTNNLIQRLKDEFHFQEARINVVVNEYKFAKLSYQEQLDLLTCTVFATLPKIEFDAPDRIILDMPDCEYSKAVRRICRRIGDRLVGLALGVGVGYGFCHIGVLKVIEEEKIPVDVISGSSIGAFIASLWAIGKSAHEILEITGEFREPGYIWGLMDFTLPFLGFIKGNKIYKFIKKHLGNKTFYDVKLPLKIVASDVKKKESRVLDSGLLADAIMASCTMPGVFMPFKFREEILFDGGVINPLPTEVLFNMGVNKIVAVNVTPSREDILRQYKKLEDGGHAGEGTILKRRAFFGFRDYLRKKFKANILDFIFSSIEILQSEVAAKEAQLADAVLHPDTSGLYWLELHKAEEFARRGEEEARRNLAKIWQVINS